MLAVPKRPVAPDVVLNNNCNVRENKQFCGCFAVIFLNNIFIKYLKVWG